MGMWRWAIGGAAGLVVAGLAGTAAWLWTPSGPHFDAAAAKQAAQAYDARVIRDHYGVPHIYGARNADVVFGLAYAHAEDDWPTIEQVIAQNRAQLARLQGKSAAASDYLMLALGNIEAVNENYDAKVSSKAKAIAEGYAAGLNLWCANHPASGCARTAPVTGRDVIAGYANRPPFFYGLDTELAGVIQGKGPVDLSVKQARAAYLGTDADVELGSNGIAVSPKRSADGHTRLAVNSHQPYTGPVAWYEARLKSDEGIDMIGGVFPGSPLILHGAGPTLGWAATVNKPDVSDVFLLTVDDPKKPTRYKLDGQWRDFIVKPLKFRVKLWGPFSLPVERRGLRSVQGPAFVTDRGVFAVSYAGDGDLNELDQYLAMNMAKTVGEWRAAQSSINAIPSINYVVADNQGTIAYFYNARMPKREEGWDRHKVLPGDTSETLWKGFEPVESLPAVIDPPSGFVENSNNTPFAASSPEDSPKPDAFPESFGIERNMTNRAMRAHELIEADHAITRDKFIEYKMDHRYSPNSSVRQMIAGLVTRGPGDDPSLKPALDLLASWDGSADMPNRATALAIFTGQKARGGQINEASTPEKDLAALRDTSALLMKVYGRIDPQWSEVSRLQRGDKSWPLNGGPDTLRAVYAAGDLEADKFRHGVAGDTYIVIADWAPDGTYRLDTIHQFGSATVDASSPHYADQAPLFAEEKFKSPPMELPALLAEATSDTHLGKSVR
ncbi:MAG: hypothetical protein GC155_09915 [Alphaproteobacteria bacterium]|nr:hypothetical protein [Alphaproteobacteria bacterium]